MKILNYHSPFSSWFRLLLVCLLGVMSITTDIYGQEKPPRPIKIRVQPLDAMKFGAFCQGSAGGTVIINAQTGLRSATGDIVLLSTSFGNFSPAIIQVQALKGTVVSFPTGLTGSLSGPGTLALQVGTTYPLSPFVVTTDPPLWMDIRVGGTLIVGTPGSNPPGSYSGTFNVTFIQE
jgi:hypothetical protein